MVNRTRPIVLRCPVTTEERQLIEQKMAQLPTKRIGDYLRKMAIDGYIIQVDRTPIKEQTLEIQRIANNINQIAKRVNGTSTIYEDDITELKEMLKEVWRLQRLNLLKAR